MIGRDRLQLRRQRGGKQRAMLRLRQHPPALYVSSRCSGLSALQGEAVPAAVGHEEKRGCPAAPGLGFPRGNRGTATRPRSATPRSRTSRTPGSGTKRNHPAVLFSTAPGACHKLGWKRHNALKNTQSQVPSVTSILLLLGRGTPFLLPSFFGGAFPLAQPPRRASKPPQGFQTPP